MPRSHANDEAGAKFLRVLQEHEFQRLGGTRVRCGTSARNSFRAPTSGKLTNPRRTRLQGPVGPCKAQSLQTDTQFRRALCRVIGDQKLKYRIFTILEKGNTGSLPGRTNGKRRSVYSGFLRIVWLLGTIARYRGTVFAADANLLFPTRSFGFLSRATRPGRALVG